ncbi:MAG: DMT family transporter [Candidatus Zixiibacteriota bacterium]
MSGKHLQEDFKKPRWLLYPIILIGQFLTAIAFPIAKIGLNDLDPLIYAFIRFFISTLIYLPIILILSRKTKIPVRDHLRILIIGLLMIPCNQVLFLIGQSKTSAGHSSLLFATVPIFIYIMAIIFLKEKTNIRKTSGILIASIGVYIILSGGHIKFGPEFLIGDLLILVAVIAWAASTILIKPLAMEYGAFRITGTAIVYGSLAYFPFGLYKMIPFELSGITLSAWLSVLYMAIIVTVFSYFMWYWTLKYMAASRLAIAQNFQPIIATAVAAIYLAEPIGLNFVVGGIIVMGGVIITEL